MSNFRESSKQNWTSSNSTEHINAGSLQRIADATEAMSQNYVRLQKDKDFLENLSNLRQEEIERLRRSNAALRGQITKLKRKMG